MCVGVHVRTYLPKALVNSAFDAGVGAHRLTGPLNLLELRANSMPLTASSTLIQLRPCLPDPIFPPPPTLNNGASLAKRPPFLDNTTPFLTHTVLPAFENLNASVSHSSHTRARNPDPLGPDSVKSVVESV